MYRYTPDKTVPDEYWVELSYLLKKHKPVSLAEAFHLVSIVEVYICQHVGGDLRKSLRK